MYELKTFAKNGVSVNAVYVVQKGDTLHGIEAKVKRSGGDPRLIYRIDGNLRKGLAPGQLVYYYSQAPRLEIQKDHILNYYEILRVPHEVLELHASADFKEVLDQKMNYQDGWRIVFLNNRMTIPEFRKLGKYKFRIYRPQQEVTIQVGEDGGSVDEYLASSMGNPMDSNQSVVRRAPSSSDDAGTTSNSQAVIFAAMFVAVVLFIWFKRKKREKVDLY